MIKAVGTDWALSTVSLSGSLAGKLEAIATAGFRHVELFHEDILDSGMSPRAIARIADDQGLSIVTIFPLRDFQVAGTTASTHPAWIDAGLMLDTASELNAEILVVCSNTRPEALDDLEAVARDVAALADRAGTQGLRIGYEALSWGTHVRSIEQAARVVRLANRANLGLILDNFHHAWVGGGLDSIRQLKREEIVMVQLSDARLDRGMDAMTLSRNFRCFPGQGELPVRDFYDAIREIGYRGHFGLEVFNSPFRSLPVHEVCDMAMQSLSRLLSSPSPVSSGSAAQA